MIESTCRRLCPSFSASTGLNQRQSRYYRRRPHSVKWGHLKVISKGCLDRGNHVTYLESRLISN